MQPCVPVFAGRFQLTITKKIISCSKFSSSLSFKEKKEKSFAVKRELEWPREKNTPKERFSPKTFQCIILFFTSKINMYKWKNRKNGVLFCFVFTQASKDSLIRTTIQWWRMREGFFSIAAATKTKSQGAGRLYHALRGLSLLPSASKGVISDLYALNIGYNKHNTATNTNYKRQQNIFFHSLRFSRPKAKLKTMSLTALFDTGAVWATSQAALWKAWASRSSIEEDACALSSS